jgi:hypothetical protein
MTIRWRSDDDQMIDHMLQFYDTNLISTYCSIRNRIENSLIQSMIDLTDKTH